jgi:hypothetical protein
MAKKLIHENSRIVQENFSVPTFQYRNSSLILYNQWTGNRNWQNHKFNYKPEFIPILELPTLLNQELKQQFDIKNNNTAYSGEFTHHAKKRMKKTIDILLQLSTPKKIFHPILKKTVTHQLSVITLTISNEKIIHPSESYNKLLKPFIQWLTKTQEVKYYIWKLEFQSNTNYKGKIKKYGGQIHYHITLPNIIHYKQIRDKWNYLQKKNNLLESYFKEHNHYNPNSTDIHKVYKIKNLQSYLEKEFIKSHQNTNPNKSNYNWKFNNKSYKLWDCSINLKSKKLFSLEINNNVEETIGDILYKENLQFKCIETEHASIFNFKQKTIHKFIPDLHKEKYYQYLKSIETYQKKSTKKTKEICSTNQNVTQNPKDLQLF